MIVIVETPLSDMILDSKTYDLVIQNEIEDIYKRYSSEKFIILYSTDTFGFSLNDKENVTRLPANPDAPLKLKLTDTIKLYINGLYGLENHTDKAKSALFAHLK